MPAELSALLRAAEQSEIAWSPGQTVHSDFSSLAARSRLGAEPPEGRAALLHREQTARASLTTAEAQAAKPPAKVDWRSKSGGNYITSVKDQAGCGSCVAFGTVAVLESMVRIAAKQATLSVNLSEAFVFFCLGPKHGAGACPDGGWWPEEALSAMKAGVSDEANYRYTDADQPCRRGSDWKSRLTRFGKWTHTTSITAMKNHLATVGPLVACFSVYEDFFYYYTAGIYTYHKRTSGDLVGGHCVQIVGYDDAKKCWIAKNSWGTGWGEDGYFRIAYGSAGIDAEMWGIGGTITSPLIRTASRLVAAGAGQVWHARRSGSGSWQKTVDRLDTGTAGDPGNFTSVTAAATINRLHVVGLIGGKPWYSRQRTGAGWAAWARPSSTLPSGVTGFTAVATAATGDTLHVAALGNGAIWHASRDPSGTWSKKWTRVTPAGPGTFTALSCVTTGSQPSVVAVAAGKLHLTTRKKDGTWPKPSVIAPGTGTAPPSFTAVGAASVGGRLNLVALNGGLPWHLERGADATWGAFRELRSTSTTAPTSFSAVACADVGLTLQVVALAAGRPWLTMRNADGSWRESFGDVGARITGEPTLLESLDIA